MHSVYEKSTLYGTYLNSPGKKRNKQKLTEEWGCETGTGAAFLGSKILIWIVIVIVSGYGKSGTCSGFWKKTAREIRHTSFQSNIQGSFFSPEGCFPLTS